MVKFKDWRVNWQIENKVNGKIKKVYVDSAISTKYLVIRHLPLLLRNWKPFSSAISLQIYTLHEASLCWGRKDCNIVRDLKNFWYLSVWAEVPGTAYDIWKEIDFEKLWKTMLYVDKSVQVLCYQCQMTCFQSFAEQRKMHWKHSRDGNKDVNCTRYSVRAFLFLKRHISTIKKKVFLARKEKQILKYGITKTFLGFVVTVGSRIV